MASDDGQAIAAESRFGGTTLAARHRGPGMEGGAVQPSRAARPSPRGHAPVHHTTTGRVAALKVERGTVIALSGGTVQVQLQDTANRVIGPLALSLAIPTSGIVGKSCLVVALDPHNLNDAVVVATW